MGGWGPSFLSQGFDNVQMFPSAKLYLGPFCVSAEDCMHLCHLFYMGKKNLKSYLFIECLLRVQHKGKLFLTKILTTDAGDSSCDHSNFAGEDPGVLEQEDLPLHLDIGSAMLGRLP